MKRTSDEMDAEPAAAADAIPPAAEVAKRLRAAPVAALADRIRTEVRTQHAPWKNMFLLSKDIFSDPHLAAALREVGMGLTYPGQDAASFHVAMPTGDRELYDAVLHAQYARVRHGLRRMDSATAPVALEMVPLAPVIETLRASKYVVEVSAVVRIGLEPWTPPATDKSS
jgi:hypothetical protein